MSVEFLYVDDHLCVAVKPAGVLSTDEPGGMPELVRAALHTDCIRTVHRLDRVVSGVMVLARSAEVASALSAQIRNRRFDKTYLAVIHGVPPEPAGTLTDLLLRNKQERKTYIVHHLEKGVQEAILDYETKGTAGGLSLVEIRLRTGRTHQIRAQFSGRGMPLAGDRKYWSEPDEFPMCLWSHSVSFFHPVTGAPMTVTAPPPSMDPWTRFL